MLLRFGTLLCLFIAKATSFHYDYNIYTGDKFEVFCGNEYTKIMEILWRGDAYRMYSPSKTGCEAVEVDSAQWEISDALTDDLCRADKTPNMEVYTLDVVIQLGNVRAWNDPFYLVTCSFEVIGNQVSGLKGASTSELARAPQFFSGANDTAKSTFTLGVRDVHDKEFSTVNLGNFIQLVAFMEPVGSEVSFRVWDCRAYTNATGTFAEYNLLVDGCGDDKVIRVDRGFLTQEMESDQGETMRIARSVFFRAFALQGSPSLQFECDFVVTRDESGDGPSCHNAPAAVKTESSVEEENHRRRKKRNAGWFTKSSIMDMNTATSDVITLLPRYSNEGVLTYDFEDDPGYVRSKQPEKKPDYATSDSHKDELSEEISRMEKYYKKLQTYLPWLQHNRQPMPPPREDDSKHYLLGEPLVVGLIIACTLLAVLPTTITILVTQCRKKVPYPPPFDPAYNKQIMPHGQIGFMQTAGSGSWPYIQSPFGTSIMPPMCQIGSGTSPPVPHSPLKSSHNYQE